MPNSPLFEACLKGDSKTVKSLLLAKADVNYSGNEDQQTAIFAAMQSRSVECAQLLLHAGADVKQTAIGLSAVSCVCRGAKFVAEEMAQVILQNTTPTETLWLESSKLQKDVVLALAVHLRLVDLGNIVWDYCHTLPMGVILRCRPMNNKEKEANQTEFVHIDTPTATVTVHSDRSQGNVQSDNRPPNSFSFHAVLGKNSTQHTVYASGPSALVQHVLEGKGDAAILAYGQTGSGKTFTMAGAHDTDGLEGIVIRAVRDVFTAKAAAEAKSNGSRVISGVSVSCVEMYNEQLVDLLDGNRNGKDLRLRQCKHGIRMEAATIETVENIGDFQKLQERAHQKRIIESTLMGRNSARSSLLTFVFIDSIHTDTTDAATVQPVTHTLGLIDLAGSELQVSRRGTTLREASRVSLPLAGLRSVTNTRFKQQSDPQIRHVPYRDSKLTRLLQHFLSGNAPMLMIATVCPTYLSADETLSTLKFANRFSQVHWYPYLHSNKNLRILRPPCCLQCRWQLLINHSELLDEHLEHWKTMMSTRRDDFALWKEAQKLIHKYEKVETQEEKE
mmetsp:Transcript_5718/g.10904  ORF Transcript_5718/g.10904 Transcript_5718/m.10904 type:complete len:560 (+) Transcript_5718:158-1837(+)